MTLACQGFLLCIAFWTTAGAAVFVEVPPSTVYIPPAGFGVKEVTCATKEASNITWVDANGMVWDQTTYNITATSNRSSTMFLSFQLLESLPGTFVTRPVHCRSGSAMSDEFMFARGALQSPLSGNPSNASVTEGMDVLFTCSYHVESVKPALSVTWSFRSQFGDSETLNETGLTDNQGILTRELQLTDVKRSSAGTYRCVIQNEFGTLLSLPARLVVQYFDGVNFTVSPSAVIVSGREVTLKITVSAIPVATEIRLSRTDGPFFSSSNSSLNRPLGKVTVSNTNYVEYNFTGDASWNGNVSAYVATPTHRGTSTVDIVVLGPIDASITAVCSNTSLLIQWTVSSSDSNDVTNYTLRWRRMTGGSTWPDTRLLVSVHAPTTQHRGSYVLSRLEPETLYEIQIELSNKYGSRRSNIVSKTTASVPASPVLDSRPVSVEEASVGIRWSVGKNGGAEISSYVLIWSTSPTFLEGLRSLNLSVAERDGLTQQGGTWLLAGLVKGSQYYVKVEAHNCVGYSTSSVASFVTRCDPGMLSLRRVGDKEATSIELLLDAPSERGCGAIIDYLVRDNSTSNTLTSAYSIDNDQVTINITGLEAGKQYAVRVSAMNNRSWEGPSSQPIAFRLDEVSSPTRGTSSEYFLSSESRTAGILLSLLLSWWLQFWPFRF